MPATSSAGCPPLQPPPGRCPRRPAPARGVGAQVGRRRPGGRPRAARCAADDRPSNPAQRRPAPAGRSPARSSAAAGSARLGAEPPDVGLRLPDRRGLRRRVPLGSLSRETFQRSRHLPSGELCGRPSTTMPAWAVEVSGEAVSATLDRESPGVPQRWVDAAPAGCPPAAAGRRRRRGDPGRARLAPRPPVPDVTAAVLGRLPVAPSRRRHWVDDALPARPARRRRRPACGQPPALSGGMPTWPPRSHIEARDRRLEPGLAAASSSSPRCPGWCRGAPPFLLSFTAALTGSPSATWRRACGTPAAPWRTGCARRGRRWSPRSRCATRAPRKVRPGRPGSGRTSWPARRHAPHPARTAISGPRTDWPRTPPPPRATAARPELADGPAGRAQPAGSGSRSTGQDMHRGPPRPLPSSVPAIRDHLDAGVLEPRVGLDVALVGHGQPRARWPACCCRRPTARARR